MVHAWSHSASSSTPSTSIAGIDSGDLVGDLSVLGGQPSDRKRQKTEDRENVNRCEVNRPRRISIHVSLIAFYE